MSPHIFVISVNSFDLMQALQILSLVHPSKTGGTIEICKSEDRLLLKRDVTEISNKTIDIPCVGALDGKIIGNWLSVPDLVKNLKFGTTEISGQYGLDWVKFNDYYFSASTSIHPKSTAIEEIRKAIEAIDLENSKSPPKSIEELAHRYERDTTLISLLKTSRGNKCQICEFSFKCKNGEDYSEAHHLEHLSNSGLDVSKNIIILCANHHRQFHFGNSEIIKHDYKSVTIKIDGNVYTCNF